MPRILETPYDCYERIDELSLSGLYIQASNLARTGWVLHGIPNPETVAQHQIHACLMVVRQFRDEIMRKGVDIIRIQDTLLIHDIAEPDKRVGDITPHCGISSEDKRKIEEKVIREIFYNNPYLLNLWLDYEYERTAEGKISKEVDKLQAIQKASFYKEVHKIPGLVEEFFTHSVITKKQIQTDFLIRHAVMIYEDKAR